MRPRLKRAHDAPEASDGTRILVDGLWPRGLSREKAALDLWLKEVAPSADLRRWYGHDPGRWDEFRRRYFAELDGNAEAVERLRAEIRRGRTTLVYATKDGDHSNARALLDYLQR